MSRERNVKENHAKRDDHVIPDAIPLEELDQFVVEHSAHEAADIARYVEGQCRQSDETVLHAEKVKTERVMGKDHEVWDVHTDKERYWVITNGTNLYSQKLMPSMDYTISFHIGLTARVMQRSRSGAASEEQREFLMVTNRKLSQADEASDLADEAEEFQAVGVRCRECLLALVRELTSYRNLFELAEPPKAADFLHWSEAIANAIAAGDRAEFVRGYLKTTAERAWRLVNWLTHAANATRTDATIAVSATSHVVDNFGTAALRKHIDAPDRCERCGSYRIAIDWRPEIGRTGAYVPRCESCGTEKQPQKPARPKKPKPMHQD